MSKFFLVKSPESELLRKAIPGDPTREARKEVACESTSVHALTGSKALGTRMVS